MCHSSLLSGEYGKRPDSAAPADVRGQGGLPDYGSPDRIFNALASAYTRNRHAQIDPAEMLDISLQFNNNRFFEAICGCYNAGRNLAAYERNHYFPNNGFQADGALRSIRPENDPYQSDKAGPVYHLFGIGVVTFGVGHQLAELGAVIQQYLANTNTADRFKHDEVGRWAVRFFYQIRREKDWWFDKEELLNDTVSRMLFY